MRKILCSWVVMIFICFAQNSDPSFAKEKGALGAGLILGDPIGPTLKYWFNPNTAIDVGLGFEKDFTVYSDYLWHGWTILPQPPGSPIRREKRG